MASISLSLAAEDAVRLMIGALDRHQLRAVRNFDLRNALGTQDVPCPCPHHGTADCDCNYVVLSIYDTRARLGHDTPLAGQIVIHNHSGSTWLTWAADPDAQATPEHANDDRRLLRALAEVVAATNQ